MKWKSIVVILWIIFTSITEDKTEYWIIVHESENTTVKVKNDFYMEYLELSMQSTKYYEKYLYLHSKEREDNIIHEYLKKVKAYEDWEFKRKIDRTIKRIGS